jgi:hypothetical protein
MPPPDHAGAPNGSPQSTTPHLPPGLSDRVQDEVTKAFAEERRRGQLVLFPVRLDDAVLTTAEPWAGKLRDNRNIGDFTRWKRHDSYQKALDRLLRDLRVGKG